ncbi:hypothetical protein E0485_15535 [Paenibacillus albiflavus]|uniref:Uncharacterized protein n=1 Tax=Paenibacillus albiflavus TaxID=2545760 RepID=A0A4R4ECA4_9BACL|nr:hypothetical protein [Paenibacillus albiflavus]TCZ75791.1 hypothetical protein E0485_15535 [Paenibacillus albiflavus]
MFKKLFYTFIIILFVIVAIVVGAVIYAKPAQDLDWSYSKVSLTDKAWQMAKSLKTEMVLSEEEVNSLFKERYKDKAKLPHDIQITGIHFNLRGNTVDADVNLLWKGFVEAGAKIRFDMEWSDGKLIVRHTQTKIKNITIPLSTLQLPTIEVPIDDKLPALTAIKDLKFESDHIRVLFKLKIK